MKIAKSIVGKNETIGKEQKRKRRRSVVCLAFSEPMRYHNRKIWKIFQMKNVWNENRAIRITDNGGNCMDPIALLRSRYDTLTNAEQKLADYIISNPRCMLEGRMSQLSKNAGSSNAALARLCQKLGYDGCSEFRV